MERGEYERLAAVEDRMWWTRALRRNLRAAARFADLPDGRMLDFVKCSDPFTTNICFGGSDLRTAFVTLSGHGQLASFQWPRPGLPLNFLNK